MFQNIGFPELLVIFFIALLVFGGKRLPEVGRGLGEAIGNFKRAMNDGTRDSAQAGRDRTDAESRRIDDKEGDDRAQKATGDGRDPGGRA